MKKLSHALLLSLALAFVLGCDKNFDYEYAVVCEFLPLFREKNWLIVTAEDGTVLKEIAVAEGATGVSEKFTLSQREPNELLNLHLVQDNPNDLWRSMAILSHYGVKNGQSVRLHDRYGFVPALLAQREVEVTIKGLASGEWVVLPGCSYRYVSYPPNAIVAVSLQNGQGMLIQNAKKQAYLSGEAMSNSETISIDQFAETQKKLGIQLPPTDGQSDTATLGLSVQAVSLDLRYHVPLGEQGGKCGEVLYFDLPNGLAPNWNFHISCLGKNYLFEKTFPPSDPIRLSGPSTGITSISSLPGYQLSVICSGPVDWLCAKSQMSTPTHYLNWTVMGSPTTFKDIKLPTSDQLHLPIGVEIFKTYTVSAFHSPEYGYDGIAAGFPWKSNEPFVAGRKGYEMVQK